MRAALLFATLFFSLASAGAPKYSKTINFTDTPSTPDAYNRIRDGAVKQGCTPKQHTDSSTTFHCDGNLIVFRESRTEDGTRTGNVSVYCQNLSDEACSTKANDIMTAGGVSSR